MGPKLIKVAKYLISPFRYAQVTLLFYPSLCLEHGNEVMDKVRGNVTEV